MEVFDTDIERELYREALRRHILQQIACTPSRDLQNASYFNFGELFTSSCSIIQGRQRHVQPKRKDSGDFFSLGNHQEVNYHKIIIEKCNRNVGCMCKPAGENSDRPLDRNLKDKEHASLPGSKVNHPPLHSNNPHQPSAEIKHKSIENQTSKQSVVVMSTPIQTDIPINDPSNKNFNKTETPWGSSSGKHDVPMNFNKVTHSFPEVEIRISPRKEKLNCGCQADDANYVPQGSYVPNQMVDDRKQGHVRTMQRGSPNGESTESSSSSSCHCEKRRKGLYQKQPNRDLKKVDAEKSIQTREVHLADKADQAFLEENPVHVSTSDSKDSDDQEKQVTVCTKCGKASENHCNKCCKACTKNTIVLPPKPMVASDQANTLRTLIKMEAKQNYRQVNIILQELNDQKNEIKKLIELYQSLSKNAPDNKLETTRHISEKRDYFVDSPLQKPQTVNICEGCGLHFYRTSLVDRIQNEKVQTQTVAENDKMIIDEQGASQNVDSNKSIKKPKKSKSKTSKDQANINAKTSKNAQKKGKTDSKHKKELDSVLTLYKEEKNKPSQGSVSSDGPITDLKKPTIKPEILANGIAAELQKSDTAPDESKVENEKSNSLQRHTDEKSLDDKNQSKSKTFLKWCKKSLVKFKEKGSKNLKRCGKCVKDKLKDFRKNKTDQSNSKEKSKSVFSSLSERFKKKKQTSPVKKN